MTFASARVSMGTITRRALEFGDTMPSLVNPVTEPAATPFSPLTVTPPAGAIGDLIFLCLAKRSSGLIVQEGGETFEVITSKGFVQSPTSGAAWIGWRFRTASDTTYDFTIGNWAGGVCYAITGADPVNPIADWSESFGINGLSVTAPAVASGITNCLLMHCFMSSNGLTGTPTVPGDDEIVDHGWAAHGGSSGFWHVAAHEPHASGGGTGSRTHGIGASQEARHGALVLIQPPSTTPSFLQLEGSTDVLLFEDGSGRLILEN